MVELYVLHTLYLKLKINTLNNCSVMLRLKMVVRDTSWRWWSYCSSRKRCCCCCHFVRCSTYKLEYLILALLLHYGRFLCKFQLNQYKIMILYQPTLGPGRNTCGLDATLSRLRWFCASCFTFWKEFFWIWREREVKRKEKKRKNIFSR